MVSNSLSHGLSIFQDGKMCGKETLKLETNGESSKVCFLYLNISLSTNLRFGIGEIFYIGLNCAAFVYELIL